MSHKPTILAALVLIGLAHCRASFNLLAQENSIVGHVQQAAIDEGRWTDRQLIEAGRRLFIAKFTKADGAGRPGATGSSFPRTRQSSDLQFARSIGPDANSCAGCHNDPIIGGSGDFVANVFVGLGDVAWSNMSLSSEFSAERGSPDLFGLGIVELLAREVTEDLHLLRDQAIARSRETGQSVEAKLQSKGIQFGSLTVHPDGQIDTDRLEGIDRDLVIKPFSQKGTVVSLREFTVNALNLHHGMQAVERFGNEQTGTADYDLDGVADEITLGDVTALTMFQASLPLPGSCFPRDPHAREIVAKGERLFTQVGCSNCHVPELELRSPIFHEPSAYNVLGTTDARQVAGRDFNLSHTLRQQSLKEIERQAAKQTVKVRLFSDLKRHVISDNDHPHFNNETVEQRILPSNIFLTKRLWTVGNTAPYGHRGDLTTIREAILAHGGEAGESRSLFEKLEDNEQAAIVKFLKTLQVLPLDAALTIEEPEAIALPYASDPKLP